MFLICGRFQFFTTNLQLYAVRNRFVNSQTKTLSPQFADLRTDLRKCPPLQKCFFFGGSWVIEFQTVSKYIYGPHNDQRWSRGHKVRGQGHKCKCFSKKKELKNFFRSISKKKVQKNIFQPIYKLLTIQKIVLS